MRNFYIAMKRELKMSTQNTRNSVCPWVHFQRYLFAYVEDIDTKRERFLQKREGKIQPHVCTQNHIKHSLKGKREREYHALYLRKNNCCFFIEAST